MTNPLFAPSSLPNFAPPFGSISESDYLPAVEAAIAGARKNIDAIKNDPSNPTFENTILPLETCGEILHMVTSLFYNQLTANGTDSMQMLAEKIGPLNTGFINDITLDPVLFKKVSHVWKVREKLNITVEEQTVLDNTYQGFIRNGALLDDKKKKRLREISERLSVLSPQFANNATKSAESFELILSNEDDLSGLPESARGMARHSARERGYEEKWLFTLDFPSVIPFLQYADKRDLREKMWRGFASRGYAPNGEHEYDNRTLLLEIVRLRDERAKLLGFKTHAEYVLNRRMAEKTENVMAFLANMKAVYKPAALKDLADLSAFASENGLKDDIKPWDVAYYSEKMKEHLFHFSSEETRPYFPLQKVLEGTFTHFSKLFGLKFSEATNKYPVWHSDVQVFDVSEEKSGRFIGTLYADFYPRTGKKQGAWMTDYRPQGLFQGHIERPVIAIVCNFTKPTPTVPSLLTHNEVLTLFHEMGHAVHGLLSDVTYASVSGTAVKWDFVELPSQVQENWCYERETLNLVAGHFETGEKLPQDLIDKMIASKNFMAGMAGLRQVGLGTLDMAWHTTNPDDITSVEEFEDKITADTSLFPRYAGPTSASFSHIFAGGYAAGYYSYKWAEVLDADTFEYFKEEGLYNQKVAESYKTNILSRGGTEAPQILYKRFRGRDADPKAVLRREGLL